MFKDEDISKYIIEIAEIKGKLKNIVSKMITSDKHKVCDCNLKIDKSDVDKLLSSVDIFLNKIDLMKKGMKIEKEVEMRKFLEDEILKRRLAEELLKNERDFITTVLDTTTLLIVVLDTDGRIIRFNKFCEDMTGYISGDVVGEYVWDLFPSGKSTENIKGIFSKIKYGNYNEKFNTVWNLKSSKKRVISWSSTCILNSSNDIKAIVITGMDITEMLENEIKLGKQKRELERNNVKLVENQKAIKSEKDRAEKYLNIAGVIIIAVNISGEVTLINDTGCEILGKDRNEILGKRWIDIAIQKRHRQAEYEKFDKILAGEIREEHHIESEIINSDDEERIIVWKNKLLYHDDGSFAGVLSSGNDVTKQKEIDIMKSELINTVSHEIRTPLGSILGFSELILKRDISTEKTKSYIQTIHKESLRLTALINDFLDIQRMENAKNVFNMEEFRLIDILDDLTRIFERTPTHKLEIDYQKDIPIFADYNKILQVLTNLISNAIKYSPNAKNVKVNVEVLGEVVNFCVQDFGFGIERKHTTDVFIKFYRIEQSEKLKIEGTGLGLAICKEIVSAHGGIIWFESEVGKGSKFYFSIPLERE